MTDLDGLDAPGYTVCGWRIDGRPITDLVSVCGYADGADTADTAIDFLRADVISDVATDGHVCTDLALACVHRGDIPTVGELTRATDPITPAQVQVERDRVAGEPMQEFTVCGADRNTLMTLSYWCHQQSWLLAWVWAMEHARQEGYELLTARIHPLRVCRAEGYPFMDPLAQDEAAMRQRAVDVWNFDWIGRPV